MNDAEILFTQAEANRVLFLAWLHDHDDDFGGEWDGGCWLIWDKLGE